MELGIMRPHHCAIVADEFFTRVTEETKWLVVQKALLLHDRIHLVHMRVWVASLTESITTLHHWGACVKGLRATEVGWLIRIHWSSRCRLLAGRWLGILCLFSYLYTLLALGVLISTLRC